MATTVAREKKIIECPEGKLKPGAGPNKSLTFSSVSYGLGLLTTSLIALSEYFANTNAKIKRSDVNLVYFFPAKKPIAPIRIMIYSRGSCKKNFAAASQTGFARL
ncbi:MAG: hypothetical protein WBB86_03795 [Candidatus Omnitrophota bacterium]